MFTPFFYYGIVAVEKRKEGMKMKQKYEIKGIEKIINTAGKERLAQYYRVDIDSDFEKIIMKDFKKHHIPSGLEVALYFSLKIQ